jgi:AmiR/NasT family two-component response regulator
MALRVLVADEDRETLATLAQLLRDMGHDVLPKCISVREGIFAFGQPVTPGSVKGAIEVAMRRHAEAEALVEKVDQLETALERKAVIERAKGIVMERHRIDDDAAFGRLRDHARANNRKLYDVARGVADGHALLPRS